MDSSVKKNKIIGFIPVRGGSKSIPLKNIKSLFGKPLVYWIVEALSKAPSVDEIIVATDCSKIEDTVIRFYDPKVKIYKRLPLNAEDTSSTESVILEYLENSPQDFDTLFVLAQATSPLTCSYDVENAINLFYEKQFDSLLSCVRMKRFLWNRDGTPKNYDYKKRPRRQEFAGELIENGALYMSLVKNILASECRLSGRIGIYEMPEYSFVEIDEPEDWDYLEHIMSKYKKLQ